MRARILHVVYSLEPGGMENGVINMANRLDAGQYEVGILFLEKEGGMAMRLPSHSRKFVLNKKAGLDFSILPGLARAIGKFRPDIVHTHNLGPLIYTTLARGLSQLAFQLVHGEHASMTRVDLHPKKRLQRALLYTGCQAIHTVGKHMTSELEAEGLAGQPILTLSNGVDTDRFRPVADKKGLRKGVLGLAEDCRILSLVGRFGPYKGHKTLLEAFKVVGEGHPECQLVFVGGGGELEDTIKELSRLHPFSSRIHFTGFQPDPLPYYQLSDLVVVPSENEGLSNCILEAMACGTPVLTNESCGATELVKDGTNGFINPTHQPLGLARSIQGILAKPTLELDSISAKSREFVCTYYSLDSMASAYAGLYTRYSQPDGGGSLAKMGEAQK